MSKKNSEQLQELVMWLMVKTKFTAAIIRDASESKNYGKELYYKAQRDAYMEVLKILKQELELK